MDKGTIFLTGCTGFLGSLLATNLLEAGYSLKVLVRKESLRKLSQFQWAAKVEVIEGDLYDVLNLTDGMEGCAYVIHAAAAVSFRAHAEKELMLANVIGTSNMVNAAIAANIKQFIHISSIAAITGVKGDEVLNADSTTDPNMLASTYGKSKYLAETEVWRAMEEGLPITVISPSLILGNSQIESESTPALFHYLKKERPYYTQGTINYVDVRTVIEAIIKVIDNPSAIGERFVLNAGTLTNFSFFQQMARYFSLKEPSVELKPWHTNTLAFFTSLLSLFTDLPSFLSPETLRNAHRKTVYDGKPSADSLGINYPELAETLAFWFPTKEL